MEDVSLKYIRDFKMPRRQRQRERQKSNRLNKQNNNSALASRVAHFMEDVNKRRLNFLSLSELEYGS